MDGCCCVEKIKVQLIYGGAMAIWLSSSTIIKGIFFFELVLPPHLYLLCYRKFSAQVFLRKYWFGTEMWLGMCIDVSSEHCHMIFATEASASAAEYSRLHST